MEDKYIHLILKYHNQGVSLAGITSLIYLHGLIGVRYFELRKMCFKELQRMDSRVRTKIYVE
jgi:hypothetical protein